MLESLWQQEEQQDESSGYTRDFDLRASGSSVVDALQRLVGSHEPLLHYDPGPTSPIARGASDVSMQAQATALGLSPEKLEKILVHHGSGGRVTSSATGIKHRRESPVKLVGEL